jgi:hypothetical protein
LGNNPTQRNSIAREKQCKFQFRTLTDLPSRLTFHRQQQVWALSYRIASSISPQPSHLGFDENLETPSSPFAGPCSQFCHSIDSFDGRISTHFDLIPLSSLCVTYRLVKPPNFAGL